MASSSRLSSEEKRSLLQRGKALLQGRVAPEDPENDNNPLGIAEDLVDFRKHPGYLQVARLREGGRLLGVQSPFFRVHDGIAGAHSRIEGREVVNYASYNYLDLAGHPAVMNAAQAAVAEFGTTVSASRIVSGERPFHRRLEKALAEHYGVEDAVAFVSGHATNVSLLGQLLGPRDVLLHDEYAHNSIVVGARLSGAQRLPFPHNDLAQLEHLLRTHRRQAERCIIAVEGIYSMDGDYPDLPRLLEIKTRYRSWLMVDEAHSLGVLGATGRGVAEHFHVDARDVDIWMGTLSKTLASCGGYVAGSAALVEQIRYLAPGFLYSVGLAPPLAAAAEAALSLLHREPQRVRVLHDNGAYFREGLQRLGLDTGSAVGYAVIPWIVGSSLKAVRYSAQLLERNINVQPILYPAVPEQRARLRFFVSSAHSRGDLDQTIAAIQDIQNAMS
ncbi:MAG: aminotransferase class I/II-fold pyridoxal phosphate-dependent enzyme [Acidithiobacillus caldus]|uniref:8-amino-7-oxononanoate synthase n=1 Tax=Acidithiobacillus caldus TaxID=33059 RepID=A0A1E7YMX6_9PROT|nr:aminotransferase class I/II-fold pyridoxal phosphate-dependent enzyme [Acidithiobacillus caldus]OFC35392.1 8-amino-7-oxononanoate synthase [Acidithiobacillus caldus]OFC37325.1 8-amino-7-oxononanoate synthase [Acidithiobacillus caldus]OFC39604.1 8-amino-7-oxononanoate synthase [Acidithiobacillus caldus]WMT47199.1 MAG: aminotransferase class I/II-fold pyridoxal phosphate-dependent enzyme [Acidithiobacillus caldus]